MPATTQIVWMRQRRRADASRNPAGKLGLGCATLISLTMAVTAILVALTYSSISRELPSIYTLPVFLDPPQGVLLQPTRIYDRTGEHILLTLQNPAAAEREYLFYPPLATGPAATSEDAFLPRNLISATLATSDPNFWQHPGFLPMDILIENKPTLAQRLVSEHLLQGEKPGLRRTLRERILAVQVTEQFGREKILEWYLNNADYGRLAYGADAASRVYYGKSATHLSLAEAAMLAAAAEAPSLNPLDALPIATERQKWALQDMLRQRKISPEAGVQAAQEELIFPSSDPEGGPVPLKLEPDLAPAFTDLVLDQLEREIPRSELNRGGLNIFTTLNYELQMQTACAAEAQLERLTTGAANTSTSDIDECLAARLLPTAPLQVEDPPEDLAAEAIVLDPQSGQILALVGAPSRDPGTTGLPNHSPGSIATTFIYLTSFTRGFSPASLVWDIPIKGSDDAFQNFDEEYHGPMRLRIALANDYLVPAQMVLAQVGLDNVWHTAQQLGVVTSPLPNGTATTSLDPFPEMNLVQTSQSFGALGNQGVQAGRIQQPAKGVASTPASQLTTLSPLVIQRVEDTYGEVILDWSASQTRPVTTPQLAYLMTNVLSDEAARWPSFGHPNVLEIGRPAAVKTGRTTAGDSNWTVGYTPQFVVGVWTGTENTPPSAPIPIDLTSGLWRAIIQYASQELPYQAWTIPSGISDIEVCDPSGMLPTADCPNIVNEVFLAGSEPTQIDNLYQSIQVNFETDRLATVFTSPDLVADKVFMIVPPEAAEWAREAGLGTPPETYDIIPANLPSWLDTKINIPGMFDVVKDDVILWGKASGDDFAQYRIQVGEGLNPQRWFQVGQVVTSPVANGQLGIWNTSNLDGLFSIQLLVVRQDQSVERSTLLLTVDNQAPEVKITYPNHGQELIASIESITLQASIEDNLEIQSVTFYIDDEPLTTLIQPPYVVPWLLETGVHSLRVEAIDQAENSSQDTINFTVE